MVDFDFHNYDEYIAEVYYCPDDGRSSNQSFTSDGDLSLRNQTLVGQTFFTLHGILQKTNKT